VLEIVLKSTYETVVFDSAIEALLRIPQENPAIILTDLILLDLDGWQFITNLRVKGVRAPVVAVSALVVQGMRQKVIAAGFDEFVTKPIDIDILLSTINRLLKRESSA
jgi:CheY-like chemotaxis protein